MSEVKFNINDLEATEIPDNAYVREKFKTTLINLHRMAPEDAESTLEREVIYFKKALADKGDLKLCTKLTLFSAFLEIAINNLSIAPGSKSEAYIESRSANMGTKTAANWIKVARFVITTYGELNLRIRAGQILRMSNPIVIYNGDTFQPRTNERGILVIDYAPAIPRTSKEIVGAWVAIYLPHDGLDFKWLLVDDIARLKDYSIPKGASSTAGPNALYSSVNGGIDPGFLETKTIKHAMRSYTKLKVSGAAVIDGDHEDDEEAVDYSVKSNTEIEQKQNAVVTIPVETNEEIF